MLLSLLEFSFSFSLVDSAGFLIFYNIWKLVCNCNGHTSIVALQMIVKFGVSLFGKNILADSRLPLLFL